MHGRWEPSVMPCLLDVCGNPYGLGRKNAPVQLERCTHVHVLQDVISESEGRVVGPLCMHVLTFLCRESAAVTSHAPVTNTIIPRTGNRCCSRGSTSNGPNTKTTVLASLALAATTTAYLQHCCRLATVTLGPAKLTRRTHHTPHI